MGRGGKGYLLYGTDVAEIDVRKDGARRVGDGREAESVVAPRQAEVDVAVNGLAVLSIARDPRQEAADVGLLEVRGRLQGTAGRQASSLRLAGIWVGLIGAPSLN